LTGILPVKIPLEACPAITQHPGQLALDPVVSFSLFFANPACQPLLCTTFTVFAVPAGPAWALSLAGSETVIRGLNR